MRRQELAVTLFDVLERTPPPSRRRFLSWAESEPALRGIDPQQLRDVLLDRSGSVDYKRRDAVLRALLRLARVDQQAGLTLLHCLLPGARALVRRHRQGVESDEAASAVVAALWARIMRYPLDRRPEKVALNLLLDAGHDFITGRDRERRSVLPADAAGRIQAAAQGHADPWPLALAWYDSARAGLLGSREIALVEGTRVRGFPVQDVAQLLGMSYRAAIKARQRAERKLATYWGAESAV